MDTLEYLSKLLGKGTFDKKTSGHTRGRQGSSSTNFDVVGRELMFPDDIRTMPKEDCLLLITGRNPFYSKKYEYTEHPNYKYTSDYNRKYSFEHEPYIPEIIEPKQEEDVFETHKEKIAEYLEEFYRELDEGMLEDA